MTLAFQYLLTGEQVNPQGSMKYLLDQILTGSLHVNHIFAKNQISLFPSFVSQIPFRTNTSYQTFCFVSRVFRLPGSGLVRLVFPCPLVERPQLNTRLRKFLSYCSVYQKLFTITLTDGPNPVHKHFTKCISPSVPRSTFGSVHERIWTSNCSTVPNLARFLKNLETAILQLKEGMEWWFITTICRTY